MTEQTLTENNMVISVDAMGGDNSPRVVIEGLAIAAKEHPDIRFLVFGDTAKVTPLLKQFPALEKVCELRHAPEMVHNEDKPSSVIRNRNTSMFMAIDAVRSGGRQYRCADGHLQADAQDDYQDSSSGYCQYYAAPLWQICYA